MRRNLILDEDIQRFQIQRANTSASDDAIKSSEIINKIKRLRNHQNQDQSSEERKSFSKFKLFENNASQQSKKQKLHCWTQNQRQQEMQPINRLLNTLYFNHPKKIQNEPKSQIKTSRSLKYNRYLPNSSLKMEINQNKNANRRFSHNRRSSICDVTYEIRKANKIDKSQGNLNQNRIQDKNIIFQRQQQQKQIDQQKQSGQAFEIHVRSLKLNPIVVNNQQNQTIINNKIIQLKNYNTNVQFQSEKIKQTCEKQTNFQSNQYQHKNQQLKNSDIYCLLCKNKKLTNERESKYKQFLNQIAQKYINLNQAYLQLRQNFQLYVFSINQMFDQIKHQLNQQNSYKNIQFISKNKQSIIIKDKMQQKIQKSQKSFDQILQKINTIKQINNNRQRSVGKITKNVGKQLQSTSKKNIYQNYRNQQQLLLQKNNNKSGTQLNFQLKFSSPKNETKHENQLEARVSKTQRSYSVKMKRDHEQQKLQNKSYKSNKSIQKATSSFKNIQNALKNLKQFMRQ